MYSYTERLATFSSWPEELGSTLVKKLALIGQYATSPKDRTTTCVYCRKIMDGWRARDEPLLEHMKHNNNCILFHIEWQPARRYLFDIQEQNIAHRSNDPFASINWARHSKNFKAEGKVIGKNVENDPRKDGSLARLDTKEGVPFIFCIYCGVTAGTHKCCSLARSTRKKPGILTKDRLHQPYFYIKWLKGEYLEMLDSYLSYEVYIPNDKKDLLKVLLGSVEDEHAFANAGAVIRKTVERLVQEFDLELREIEKKSLQIVNERAEE